MLYCSLDIHKMSGVLFREVEFFEVGEEFLPRKANAARGDRRGAMSGPQLYRFSFDSVGCSSIAVGAEPRIALHGLRERHQPPAPPRALVAQVGRANFTDEVIAKTMASAVFLSKSSSVVRRIPSDELVVR